MAKNLFNRYIWLLDAIYKSGGITFEEINQKWRRSYLYEGKDIPLRTFHHQRIEIENLFDVEIICNKTNYRYSIDDDSIAHNSLKTWMLNTFSAGNILNESEGIKDRIVVENIASAQQYLIDLLCAMKNGVKVRIDYAPFYLSQTLDIILSPYFVKMYEGRWYVFGVRDDETTVKVYALDRITGLKPTDKRSYLPDDFSPEAYLFHSVGVIRDETKPCEILLKAFRHHPKYLRTLPLHRSQQEVETCDDYTVFRYFLCPTSDFYQKILAQREYVQIVEPEHVRLEMKRIVTKLNDYYKNN
ncbi:MAG: WYL domain-containing protein [Prevotellaceae bacterium]|nr:WYL domain-containing protein [Prevotellaceae bacterium]